MDALNLKEKTLIMKSIEFSIFFKNPIIPLRSLRLCGEAFFMFFKEHECLIL